MIYILKGVIRNSKTIDRETNSKFILNVKVNDNELPPRFGYTSVSVANYSITLNTSFP